MPLSAGDWEIRLTAGRSYRFRDGRVRLVTAIDGRGKQRRAYLYPALRDFAGWRIKEIAGEIVEEVKETALSGPKAPFEETPADA